MRLQPETVLITYVHVLIRHMRSSQSSLSHIRPDLASSPGKFTWKHAIQETVVMFGAGFEECWYEVAGVRGLELSGDLRFRGPRGLRKLRHASTKRPYVMARKLVGLESDDQTRKGRVMLHRAVMTLVLGRELGRDEFVCHSDDDVGNNWPDNLYLGDRQSNAADSLRNGGRLRGDNHQFTKIREVQVCEIRLALSRGERGVDLARAHGVHRSTMSRIKHGVRRQLIPPPHCSDGR
jgi:hypothetical protein